MEARPRSWWQRIQQHPVASVLIALLIVVIALSVLSVLGYSFNWDWVGLGPYTSVPHPNGSNFQREKTLWDWLQLLIIPAVLAVGGFIINLTISRGEQEATKQRAKIEREIAEDNQREASLQAYIDKLSELLLEKKLRDSKPEDEVRKIARVRTLTVLPRLDNERKRSVLLFLYESGLIDKGMKIIDLDGANLRGANLILADLGEANLSGALLGEANLGGADLSNADLSFAKLNEANLIGADLSGANLRGAILFGASLYGAKLGGADLGGANLHGADLHEAILSFAKLNGADLHDTNLSKANLRGADLGGASLYGAKLGGANLNRADLGGADLGGADLSEAKLNEAKVTPEQLDKAKLLTGTIMPDWSIHP